MTASIQLEQTPQLQYLLRLGDTCLILGQRLGEWCGHAPILEEDIALTNMALDLIGQARALLTRAGAHWAPLARGRGFWLWAAVVPVIVFVGLGLLGFFTWRWHLFARAFLGFVPVRSTPPASLISRCVLPRLNQASAWFGFASTARWGASNSTRTAIARICPTPPLRSPPSRSSSRRRGRRS